MIRDVFISDRVARDLRRVPTHVRDKLEIWADAGRVVGLEEVRKIPGYHDEPLKGERKGQRSIRLSRAYRAFYRIMKKDAVESAVVEEVNKHDY